MNTNKTSSSSQARGEQVASKIAETIKLGLDVHADSIRVVRIVDHTPPQPAQKFRPEQFVDWVKKQQQQAQKVYSCYEAGATGFSLHRALVKLGWAMLGA